MTGTVDFYDGSTYLGTSDLHSASIPAAASLPLAANALDAGVMVAGSAVLPINNLIVGSHLMRAVYSGDANYSAAASETPVSVQVIAATTSTSLSAVPSAGGTLLNASVFVTSPGNPPLTGVVAFYDGTTFLGSAPLSNGVASLNITALSPGVHFFSAVYSGSEAASSSTSSTEVSTDGPAVIGVSRYGFHFSPTVISLTFDGALDLGRAENPANYQILDSRGMRIRVTRAIYDPLTNRVELHLAKRLNLYRTYSLRVFGSPPGGLTGSTGIPLDGSGRNQPGTDFVTKIAWYSLGLPGRAPAVTYVNGFQHTYAGRMRVYLGSIVRASRHSQPRGKVQIAHLGLRTR